ncbi:hypothetical protein RCL_jg19119.t1 [Rhizophagus clarus]|uniref:Uncharacterized protein n=1 Tax=Rhizophagus clarus TaxID=94130 RepID=A0A8H3LXL3_9GLOM|nr:hypothetical protein RCL_jg19119.t1 [Rhizophagus clarus]
MYYEKLVFLSIAGIACVWGVSFGLSLTLAIYALSITDNKVRYTPFIIYNFVWGYIMIASIISEIMRYRKCIRERPDSPRSTLMILFLRSACEVILVVLSVRFEYYDIPRGINITNDIFKIIITLLCLLNLRK